MNKLVKSEIESDRFKLNFYRGVFESIDIKEIQKTIVEKNIDISVLRVPSNKTFQIQELSKLGFEFFQADTLVYYSLDFENYNIKELKNKNINFKKAKKDDKPILGMLVDRIFDNYQNHYFSNKYIDTLNSLEGYKQWVFNFIEKENHIVFIVYKEEKAIGFATCYINEENIAEGVLYGVLNEYSGGGIYSDIIRYTQSFYKSHGAVKMKVSTQIQNYAVQKVWSREGFTLNESFSTIHINSLLSVSSIPYKDFLFDVKEEDINKYGDISKDYNSIHFDDEEAITLKYKGKIAHALLSEGEISRILGMEYPGNNTIILNNFNVFFAPFYPNSTYRFRLTVPFTNQKGFYKILFKVYDKEDNLVMLSYNDVMNKSIKN